MAWLFILGLLVWTIVQEARIGQLERRLNERAPQPRPLIRPQPAPAAAIPAAATVAAAEAPAAAAEVAPSPPTPAEAPVVPPVPAEPRRSVSAWLAENGLAWLGGGGLMLGGLFLVVYAAEKGFFTPPLRIMAAVLAGGLMIAASEWIRRQPEGSAGRHPLAAAVAAGAGASTLYGAAWAAHVLYHLIPFEAAAALVTSVSLGLLGLALLHGEALAVLAMAGALAAPAVTGLDRWSAAPLTSYGLAIAATGYAAAALRRWGGPAFVTALGMALWVGQALVTGHRTNASVMVIALPLAANAAVLWRARFRGESLSGKASDVFLAQPVLALILACLLFFGLWIGPGPGVVAAASVVGALLALVAAAGERLRATPGGFYAAIGVAAFLGVISAFLGRHTGAPEQGMVLGLGGAIAGWGLVFGATMVEGRARLIGSGAVGAALLVTLLWLVGGHGGADLGWRLPAAIAAVMAAAAVGLRRFTAEPKGDAALGLWIGASAELVFLAVHAAAPHVLAPALQAGVAVALALLAMRLRWRGLAATAVAGGFVTLATLLRPAFVGDVIAHRIALPELALVSILAAGLLTMAAQLVRRDAEARTEAEALDTAAIVTALLGAFLVLHAAMAGPRDVLGGLLETALRTDLILAAVLILAWRARPDAHALARWRLVALLVAGALHGALFEGLAFNPWWSGSAAVVGPPLLDTLAIAYLAPALLLAATAWRGIQGRPGWTRLTACAAFLSTMTWAFLEIRRLFHGPDMTIGAAGPGEAAAYAVTALVSAGVLIEVRRRRMAAGAPGTTSWLAALAEPYAWVALIVDAFVLCDLASPWWGPMAGPLAGAPAVALLLALIGVGAAASGQLSRLAGQVGWTAFPEAARSAAVAEAFVLITLVVRWAFHGADMHAASGQADAETWTYSAVWAAYGLAVLVAGGARKDVTLRWLGLIVLIGVAGKVALFDTQHLEGMVRAASFLAVGALLIAGALAARRLNARAFLAPRPRAEPGR